MANDESEALFELPEDLRKEVMECAVAKQISLAWLMKLYRRGYQVKLGETKQFPYGRLRQDDQGELAVAMAVDARTGVIRMEFGKPVAWLALPSAHARHLGKLLLEKADELDKKLS